MSDTPYFHPNPDSYYKNLGSNSGTVPTDPPSSDDFSLFDDKGYRRKYRADTGSSYDELAAYHQSIMDAINAPVTGITSRSQFINPNELLDFDYYARTARGKALYQEHLNALNNVYSLQQAAYEEWYNSEQQQANRLRDASLNPNLNGIEQGVASSGEIAQDSPVQDLQTVGQDALQGLSVAASLGSMVSSGISVFSQLAALPASIASHYATAGASSAAAGLSQAQTDLTKIAALEQFEKLASADVASRLADATSAFVGNAANAGKSFDFDSWFADPNNSAGIIESYAPSDSPAYHHALKRVMSKHQKAISSSYDVYGNRLRGQSNVAQMLASGYYDENLVLQVGLMEPLYQAYKQHELMQLDYETKYHQLEISKLTDVDRQLYLDNLESDLRRRIEENNYFTDYFSSFDGDSNALYDMMLKRSQAINERVRSSISANLETIYNDNPNSYMGQRALSLILGGANLAWDDYLAYLTSLGISKVASLNFGLSSPNQPLQINFNGIRTWDGTAGYRVPNGKYIPGSFGDVF